MANFGSNDGDFDVRIQPNPDSSRSAETPNARADSVGPAIQNNVNNSNSNNPYSAGRDTNSYPSNQGGNNGNNYNPGPPPGDDQFDPADPTTNIPSDDTLNEETLEAISNSYAAEAFNLIARRGVNPLRAEVLGVHEFVPVAKGEDFTPDENSITLNFGADSQTVVVNQVVRLIELHRILIQTANLLSEQLITDASGFTKDQIDGGLLIAQYFFSNPEIFEQIFDISYPDGNISDSDVSVILSKFVESYQTVLTGSPSNTGLTGPATALLFYNLLDPSTGYSSLSETALNLGLTSMDQYSWIATLSRNPSNPNPEFSTAIVKLALIRTLIPSIVTYMSEIIDIQNELNNAINFAKFDLQTATNNSDNYSKIISLCMGQSSGEIPQVSSFLDFGTGVSNAAGNNNTINFLNVVSKLYSECLFMRNHTPGDYVGQFGISVNYDYVNDTISDQVILSSGDTKIRDGIDMLKTLMPNTPETALPNSTYIFYSTVNGESSQTLEAYQAGLYDYKLRGEGVSSQKVSSILNIISSDNSQSLAELISAICYDQVVGANVYDRTVASNIRPENVAENNGTGLFPVMNIFRKILFKDSSDDNISLYQKFRNSFLKEEDDNLNEIFSNLLQFSTIAIGLNQDPINSDGRYIPLEFNNELTDLKKNAINFTGNVRLGSSTFFSDAIINNDVNLQTLNSFIEEFKSEYHKVRNFVIDYYSLGFDSNNGNHDSDFGSAGNVSSNLNPLSYFYWFMDLLADDLESAIDSNSVQNAFLIGLFAESGSSINSMLKAFKSAYWGTIVSKNKFYNNVVHQSSDIKSDFELFCYRTDNALISLLSDLFSSFELNTGTEDLAGGLIANSEFDTLLTNDKPNLTNKKFDTAGGNQRFGYKNDDVYPSSTFEDAGSRKGAKDNLRSAIGIYEDTFNENQVGGSYPETRGIRPSYNSEFLYHVLRNTPIVNGISNSVSDVKFLDFFVQDGGLQNVANPGQFGGIFNCSSFQRGLIFYMWAMKIYRSGVSVNFDLNQSNLRYNTAKLFARGTIQALRRSSVESIATYETTNDDGREAIHKGFSNTSALMAMVKDAIKVKRNNILQPLAFFEKIIKNLEELKARSEDILNASVNLNNDPQRYLAGSLIRRAGFLNSNNLIALNEVTSATLHKSLINHFDSPVDSNISKLVSVYDAFSVNDVKLMYKVLSRPGYGYNSNEKYGKKDIIHVGVPLGMLTALRNMSFVASGDERFNSSSKIAIHVVKNDELNPDVRFYPRTFVFDMERFILPKGPSGFASNHIANYSDSWSFQDILLNMQVYHSSDGGLSDGRLGGTYAGVSIPNSLGYSVHSNHVFDYYLKMYCRLTTGLDFDEESFKVSSSNLFNGSVDANMQQFFNDYTNNLIQLYPSANVNPDSAIAFARALNVSKNYVAFSSFSRIESALSPNCFDRVFSIMINERDFTVPLEDYGASSDDVFFNDPVMYPDGRVQVKPLKLTATEINIADGQSLFDPSAELSDKLDEYLKGLDPSSTHVSKYSIHISLLNS